MFFLIKHFFSDFISIIGVLCSLRVACITRKATGLNVPVSYGSGAGCPECCGQSSHICCCSLGPWLITHSSSYTPRYVDCTSALLSESTLLTLPTITRCIAKTASYILWSCSSIVLSTLCRVASLESRSICWHSLWLVGLTKRTVGPCLVLGLPQTPWQHLAPQHSGPVPLLCPRILWCSLSTSLCL